MSGQRGEAGIWERSRQPGQAQCHERLGSAAAAAAAKPHALGGIIPAVPGGTLILAGEAGDDELITPLGGPNAPSAAPSLPSIPAVPPSERARGRGATPSHTVTDLADPIQFVGIDPADSPGVKVAAVEAGVTEALRQLEDQVTR